MPSRTNYALPLAIGVAAVALVVLVSEKVKAAPSPGPQPHPSPLPPIPPLPKEDVNTLLARATALIQAAAMNPASVDPAQMESLATQLDAQGQHQVADLLRQWAQTARASKGGGAPPPPPPQPPPSPLPFPIPADPLLVTAATMIQMAQANPSSVDPTQMEAVATQLEATGHPNEASVLRQWAMTVRIARGNVPTGGPMAPPSPIVPTAQCSPGMAQLPPVVSARVAYLLSDPTADAAEIEQLAGLIAPCGFAGTVGQLTARAQLLRSMKGPAT